MRTVRRCVEKLNKGKQKKLKDLINAFIDDKRHWLKLFERSDVRIDTKQSRIIRDEAMAANYVSESGLQARMWKLALSDAAATWHKYWQAHFLHVRHNIHTNRNFNEELRHYAFWILKDYRNFFACLDGLTPEPKLSISEADRLHVANYIRRQIKRCCRRHPMVHKARSVMLDANCYTLFEKKGRQYLKIMTLERGQRIVLPLKGSTPITGNILVVNDGETVEVHVSQNLKDKGRTGETIAAIDFGYTEAFTDDEGVHYGSALGSTITAASERRNEKSKARNRLHAIAKGRARSNSKQSQQKARNIHRFNLGRKKMVETERCARETIAREINTGLNRLVKTKNPGTVVTEKLSHVFTFDKSKKWNRRLSAWTRGVIQSRVEFKALAECFRHQQVNPAYSSQTCPHCGFVDSRNRKGDVFVCLVCGYENHADRVGAMNLLARMDDPEITQYTPYCGVKDVLERRFYRRLEAEGVPTPEATVPGKTPDTVAGVHSPPPPRVKSQGGSPSRSLGERNFKQKPIQC